jgi:hypothetical protein
MIGTIVGHYRVVRKFSGGGMCTVCKPEYLPSGLCAALESIPENLDSDVTSGNRPCGNIPRREAVPWACLMFSVLNFRT